MGEDYGLVGTVPGRQTINPLAGLQAFRNPDSRYAGGVESRRTNGDLIEYQPGIPRLSATSQHLILEPTSLGHALRPGITVHVGPYAAHGSKEEGTKSWQ